MGWLGKESICRKCFGRIPAEGEVIGAPWRCDCPPEQRRVKTVEERIEELEQRVAQLERGTVRYGGR